MSRVQVNHGRRPNFARSFRVTVGVHGDEGGAAHGDDGLTVGDLASFAEFGAGNSPARAPIRTWFDENQADFPSLFRRALQFSGAAAAEAVALKLQGGIQKRIAEGLPPPNAASTIAAKGSSTPLIDTGVLRSSYLARVEAL